MKLKDEVLDELAASGANVAQFVSYGPDGKQRFLRLRQQINWRDASVKDVVTAIHQTQSDPNVNIRTFRPEKPDGNPFLPGPKFGFHDPATVAAKVKELLAEGFHLIINENIDPSDGGFSGVLYGDLFEFASRDIPRCVEKAGCARLPRAMALDLIQAVYGFNFEVPFTADFRVECSVHPGRVGYLGVRQIVWEAERKDQISLPGWITPNWPNRFSKDMGDKAFGLLVAHLLGFPVPATHVFGRVIPYFAFGFGTRRWDGREVWMRTCPHEQVPGKFATLKGWRSPARLLAKEDPSGEHLASIILQEGIRAEYSGAAITDGVGELVIEGKAGCGDSFMVGMSRPEQLPKRVQDAVRYLWTNLHNSLGDVRFEWVYDGHEAWVVQLHVGRSVSTGNIIYPGFPKKSRTFDAADVASLETLRALIPELQSCGDGVILKNAGLTSHFGDLLRGGKVPSRLE